MIEQAQKDRWRRNVNTMISRAGNDDPETFAFVLRLFEDALARMPEAAAKLRAPTPSGIPGYSYTDIGAALGISRQAARERFMPRGEVGES